VFVIAIFPSFFVDMCVLDEGYRLTYGGYDYLAMRALSKRESMYSVGNQIGVGKESGMKEEGVFFSIWLTKMR
jgi:RIO-like serine/threonine protein kinase